MNRPPEDLLDICLEMARRGEDWKSFLAVYPAHSHEVEPLVRLALGIREAAESQDAPVPGLSETLLRMGREMARRERDRKEKAARRRAWSFGGMWGSAWAKAAFAALVLVILGMSAVELSARTVPGNLLYPVKILTERVRFALASNPEDRVELRITFSERRLDEVVKTLREGQGADRQLISAMLDEAKAALSDAAKLPESKSSPYKARIASLEGIQKERLRSVERWVPPDRRGDVAQAIRMCDDGWARMQEMMCGPQQDGSSRGPRRGMGGMMMGPRDDWCR
jgi:hypothetical protein